MSEPSKVEIELRKMAVASVELAPIASCILTTAADIVERSQSDARKIKALQESSLRSQELVVKYSHYYNQRNILASALERIIREDGLPISKRVCSSKQIAIKALKEAEIEEE